MPGSIQVSVLDFKELSSSSIFVKVSLGKIEYEARDKGDFSFPLKTLRDNLIITLLDAEGNQISHAGVRTISIVEKGVWDDLFPLEGGGHIHMKLQFVLSEEERNRIRMMRESALKKKQQEILKSSLRNFETASTASDSLASSLHTHEVAVVSAADVAVKAGQWSNPGTLNKDSESSNGIKEGTIQSQTIPNSTDRKGETSSAPMPERVETTQSPHHDVPVRPILLQESSSMFGCSEKKIVKRKSVYSKLADDPAETPDNQCPIEKIPSHVKKMSEESMSTPLSQGKETRLIKKSETRLQHANVSTRLQEEALHEMEFSKSVIAEKIKSVSPKVAGKPEKQGPLEKTPSNIKKMISAFESSLSQDRGPVIKPLAVKSYKVGMVRRLLKDQVLKNVTEKSDSSSERFKNPAESSLGRLKNSFSTGDLQRNPTNITKTGELIGYYKDLGGYKLSQATRQLKESSAIKTPSKGTDATVKDEFKSAQKEMNSKEITKLPEELMRPSTLEATTVSGRMHEEGDSSKTSVVKHELKSDHRESNTKEMVKSPAYLMRPSALEEGKVSGRMDEQQDSGGTSIVEGRGKKISSNNILREINCQGASNDNLEHFFHESSGAWIFPDDSRNLCITAEGDKVMDLLGGCIVEEKSQGKMVSSVPETIGKDEVQRGTDTEVKKGDKKSHRLRNSRPKSSAEDPSTGPLGQAIKIAIIVGFGILVLLTRQRKPR